MTEFFTETESNFLQQKGFTINKAGNYSLESNGKTFTFVISTKPDGYLVTLHITYIEYDPDGPTHTFLNTYKVKWNYSEQSLEDFLNKALQN